MVTKYIYLDDESPGSAEAIMDRAQQVGELEIDLRHPGEYRSDIQEFIDLLPDYDGIILDWRLSETPWKVDKKRFPFRAAAIAQEVRTRETEEIIKGGPIVLWSTEERLEQSYYGDATPQDLFDCVYEKEQIEAQPELVRSEMISLSNGYHQIGQAIKSKGISLAKILKVQEEILDIRLKTRFSKEMSLISLHEYALFILRELIERPGPLICEKLLASRLGIDFQNSPDWNRLLNKLPSESKYRGPFCDAWPRWWTFLIERNWWGEISDSSSPLSTMPAKNRVEILKKKTGLPNLAASNPLRKGYGTKYYTLCEHQDKPLDPADGVIIDEDDPAPWQDRRYISIDTALERLGFPKLKPHPTELERVRYLRGLQKQDAQ